MHPDLGVAAALIMSAARRERGRSGRMVERRLATRRRTRRSGRSSRPSSRTPANRSSSFFHPEDELPEEVEAAVEAGKPPDFVFGILQRRTLSRDGPTRIGSSISRRPSGTSRTCSSRMRSGRITLLNATNRLSGSVWAADGLRPPTTSTFGRACWSRLDSPSRNSAGVGTVLVLLVRPGTAGGASGTRPRRRLGRGPYDVGRLEGHAERVLAVRRRLRSRLRDPRRPSWSSTTRRSGAGSSRRSTATRPPIAKAAPRPIR